MHAFDAIPYELYKDLSLCGIGTESWFGIYPQPVAKPRRRLVGDYWLFLTVIEGQLEVKHREDQVLLTPVVSTILPPGIFYWEHTQKPTRVVKVPLRLVADPGMGALPFSRFPMYRPLPFADQERAMERIERLAGFPQKRERKSVGQCLEGHLFANDLFLNALAGGYASGAFSEGPGSTDWVQQARRILEDEFRNASFTISQLATRLGKSREEVQRRFQKEFGMTPKDWLHRFRIRMAVQLLHSHPHMTVESVMHRCGYKSRSLFYSLFTRFEGASPASVRKRKRET